MAHNRRELYSDLGTTPSPGYRPPEVSSVTQHVLRGTLDHDVQCDIAYTSDELTVKFHLGPVFIILRGMAAVHSTRELIRQLKPVLDKLVPDLDAELARQRAARARINGTGT